MTQKQAQEAVELSRRGSPGVLTLTEQAVNMLERAMKSIEDQHGPTEAAPGECGECDLIREWSGESSGEVKT